MAHAMLAPSLWHFSLPYVHKVRLLRPGMDAFFAAMDTQYHAYAEPDLLQLHLPCLRAQSPHDSEEDLYR
jgi:hypothetical protein